MNVLILCEDLDPSSGWGRYASSLVRVLKANGTNVMVLTSDSSFHGPRLPKFSSGRYEWIIAEIKLRWWMRKHSFDLIHVTAEHYGRLSDSFRSIPFVITIHGTFADPRAQGPEWAVRAFDNALNNACKLIAVSRYTKEKITEPLRTKTEVIVNGVDLDITSEPSEAPKEVGKPLILSVGALKPRKGFDHLIRGFAEFAKDHSDTELVIVGDDSYTELKESLNKLASDLGVGGRVRIAGKVSRAELLGWYGACDVFALTPVSDAGFEGFGLVYIEANLFGKPSVGSMDSGARDAIAQGKSGVLIASNDPSHVSQGIREALVIEGNSIVEHAKTFAWENRVSAYFSVYQACSKQIDRTSDV